MIARRIALLLIAACLCSSCRPGPKAALAFMRSPEVAERSSRFQRAMAEQPAPDPDSPGSGMALARWLLPASLREVSGIALSPDGRLFTHGDEGGVVAVIDYRSGVLIKQFAVGKKTVHADFEGIAFARERLFMIVSSGELYEFREGGPGKRVPHRVHRTGLEQECEFEGVAYEPATESLLLACKNVLNKSLQDSLVIFRWSLADSVTAVPRITRFAIPLASVTTPIQAKTIRPSDISVDPRSGNYVLIAAQEKALLEITPAGEVVFVQHLPGEHEQSEGLAITSDGLMIISDEAVRSAATITLYRKP